jgi:superfamily II DNA/RNA helicase
MSAEDQYNPFSGFGGNKKMAQQSNNNHGASSAQANRLEGAPAVDAIPTVWGKSLPKAIGSKKHPAVTNATVAEWHKNAQITVFGDNCPLPASCFEAIADVVPSSVMKSFEKQGFDAPTKIQALSWPILMANRDIVGIAKTGSGKTLAFMIPAITHIAAQPELKRGDGPMCCVLAPTRELAIQIEEETQKVLPSHLRSACIYGGAPKGPQIQQLNAGIHIMIATPGRLIDMLEIGKTNLNRTTFLVLDEADRMLDMGFEPQVRRICALIRKDRQTLMFSATWPQEIQDMATQFQREFIRIHVGNTDLSANQDVTQKFVLCQEPAKFAECKTIVQNHGKNERVLIFCNTKRTVDDLERHLQNAGVNAMSLHGDKQQSQREWILAKLKKDTNIVVIATDVAARGLDVKDLNLVINYDFPNAGIDDYVHRIGRTGRAGKKGLAFTILCRHRQAWDQPEPFTIQRLVTLCEDAKQQVPDDLRDWASAGGARATAKPGFGRNAKMPSFSYDKKAVNNTTAAVIGGDGKPVEKVAGGAGRIVFGDDSDSDDDVPVKKARKE